MNNSKPGYSFRLLRYFFASSVLGIIAAAALIQFLYRSVAISTIAEFGETTNLTLARTALHAVHSRLVDYVKTPGPGGEPTTALALPPQELLTELQDFIRNTEIKKIKIYDREGTVRYSTNTSQIGENQKDNKGFQSALAGDTASKFIYQDRFNPFDRESADANMIQSYLPVVQDPGGDVLGVFEIYTDVHELTERTERAQLLVLLVVVGIFLLLYVLLLAIVRRAETVIRRQDGVIRDRSRTLEVLSAQLLSAQENERKHLAHLLQEDVAQTLSAVKLRMEAVFPEPREADDGSARADELNQYLRHAIQEIRTLAMRIRPSSLDDFGLLETVKWLLRDFRELYPKITVESRFQVAEGDIPRPLKTIVFRILQETLDSLVQRSEADRVAVAIVKNHDSIELRIEENGSNYFGDGASGDSVNSSNAIFGLMKERTLLSGGEYVEDRPTGGMRRHISSWPV